MTSKKKLKRKIKKLEARVSHERRERNYWLYQWQIETNNLPAKIEFNGLSGVITREDKEKCNQTNRNTVGTFRHEK